MNPDRCREMVQPRQSRGILGKGTESFGPGPLRQCSRRPVEGDTLCATHAAARDRIASILADRRAAR